jgi:hypothetical protein
MQHIPRRTGARLLLGAAVLHLLVVMLIYCTGRLGLLPRHFDKNGFGHFAFDSYRYQKEIVELSDLLAKGEIAAWFAAAPEIHVKIYSVCSTLLGPFIGFNILSVEPLNLLYYLLTVWLVFQLTELTFGRRAATIAAVTTALWPTLLMHSTQLLRDPLLILAFLFLLFVIGLWCEKHTSLLRALLVGLLAGLAMLIIFMVRQAFWDMVRFVVVFGFILIIARMIIQKRFLAGNVAGAVLLLIATWLIPHGKAMLQIEARRDIGGNVAIAERVFDEPLWKRISDRRLAFVNPQDDESESIPASNIDMHVQFNGTADIVRYLPRAAAIGLFAPFPNMWLDRGFKVGSAGRKLSGLEMLITYLMEMLALVGLWYKRRLLITWLLFLTTTIGVTSVSLIVLNIGSMYRVRYPFWILIVVLGAGGLASLMGSFGWRTPTRAETTGDDFAANR